MPTWLVPVGTSLTLTYILSTPFPPDRISNPKLSVGLMIILSVIPSARRIISPREFIALPNASMYNDIPSSDDVKSRLGNP